ncbi:MAG: T9SS type A sorting domain-containing protein [Balneolaceae bacterium]
MGRTLQLLLLRTTIACVSLFVVGEVCAVQLTTTFEDTLQFTDEDRLIQIRVEPDRDSGQTATQFVQWRDWQWVQPLGSARETVGAESMRPRLLFSEHDSLYSIPYLPPNQSVQWSLESQDTDWIVTGNPYTRPVQMDQYKGVGGDIQSSAGYLWNRNHQQFRAVSGQTLIDPGDVIVLKNLGAESIEIPMPVEGVSPAGSTRLDSERSIRFTLFNRISSKHSEVNLHFDHEAKTGLDAFDLASIHSGLERHEFPDSPQLFFQGVRADTTYFLSRDARPYNLDSPMELTLGFLSRRDSGPHRLEWEIAESLPDDWTLELTDLWTRQQIDLRQRQRYRFDGDGAVLSPVSLARGEIQSLLLEEPNERFQIRIVPRSSEQGGVQLSQSNQDPEKMELHANYPNPFSVETSVEFFLPEETVVYLNIYNVVGQRVAQLMNGEPVQGWHTETWSVGDLPSGIYILRLETPRGVLTRKMTLIR